MKSFKGLIALSALITSVSAWSYGIGYSSHPMMEKSKLLTTEMTGIISSGGGVGFQARYTQKLSQLLAVDAGLGIGGGDRNARAFVGADYELFPDYLSQPRISVKTQLEHAKEFGSSHNKVMIAPVVSKGLSLWGHEAFPFVSLPVGIDLNTGNQTYQTTLNFSTGMTGRIPLQGFQHLTGNIEATVNIKDSYTALFAGVSYPL